MQHRTIAARRRFGMAHDKLGPIDRADRGGLALLVRVEAQLVHNIVDSSDAATNTSLVSSRWPSKKRRFSQAVMARNSNKRTQA